MFGFSIHGECALRLMLWNKGWKVEGERELSKDPMTLDRVTEKLPLIDVRWRLDVSHHSVLGSFASHPHCSGGCGSFLESCCCTGKRESCAGREIDEDVRRRLLELSSDRKREGERRREAKTVDSGWAYLREPRLTSFLSIHPLKWVPLITVVWSSVLNAEGFRTAVDVSCFFLYARFHSIRRPVKPLPLLPRHPCSSLLSLFLSRSLFPPPMSGLQDLKSDPWKNISLSPNVRSTPPFSFYSHPFLLQLKFSYSTSTAAQQIAATWLCSLFEYSLNAFIPIFSWLN